MADPAKLRVVDGGADSAEPEPTDDQLVMAARERDTRSWALLYQRHYLRVFRYVTYLVRDRDVAEDLTQETFARAVQSIGRYRGDAAFTTWLDRIALNVARERWRKDRSRQAMKDRLALVRPAADLEATLPATQFRKLEARVLFAVIERLPHNLREAFVLRDMLGMDIAEAAEQLAISKSNAAVRAHRARRRIEKELRKLGWIDEAEVES